MNPLSCRCRVLLILDILLDRILWIALFMVGLLFAVLFSWNLWENWQQSPVLITIQTANYPVKTKLQESEFIIFDTNPKHSSDN